MTAFNLTQSGEGEKFYDEEIAPALRAIAEKCKERGLSLVASVQFGPADSDRGTTHVIHPHTGLSMQMVHRCEATAPNIDGFMLNLARYCHANGIDTSASFYMSQFGGSNGN